MTQSNAQNSIKNVVFAVFLRVLQIVLPFVIRTVIIHSFGLAYVGVSGLFASVFGILSIAELGVGSALLQALYEPIKKNDICRIRAILNFYRKSYFAIGLIISILGIAILPFIKYLIKEGSYPEELNIYYIYVANLVSTVIGYLVYSYKALLLEANQRGRDANKVRILFTFMTYGFQCIILFVTHNYYMYISVVPLVSFLTAITIARVCDRKYAECYPYGDISEDDRNKLKTNISALFLYKVGSVVNNNVDGIVISAILGATIMGVYNNYYYIVSSLSALITVCYTAILPSVGNSISGKENTDNYILLLESQSLDNWINGWGAICLACLLPNFILLWVGEEGSLGKLFAVLFGVFFYFWRIMDPISMFKDALGVWREDRWRPLAAAVVNVIANILLVNVIGVYGILLSTIAAVVCISFPFSVKALTRHLGRGTREYLMKALAWLIFDIAIGSITWLICQAISVENILCDFILDLLLCIIVPNIAFFAVNRKNTLFTGLLSRFRGRHNE